MISVLRVLVVFALAVAVTAVLLAAINTQFVIAAYDSAARNVEGVSAITFSERVDWTLHDIRTMNDFDAPSELLAVVVTIALGVAFLVADLLSRLMKPLRGAVFLVAGACGISAALYVLDAALGLQPIAGARGMVPLLVHGLAGAMGGVLFAALTPAPGSK